MDRQPVLIMLLCFIAGILLCDLIAVDAIVAYGVMVVAVVLLGFSFFRNRFFLGAKNFILGIFFTALGFFAHFIHSDKAQEILLEQGKREVVFQLHKKLNSSEKYRKYEVEILQLDNKKTSGFNLILSVHKEGPQLDFRHFYSTTLYVNKVEPPGNDFQFDYARYISRKKIFHQAFATDEILTALKPGLSISEKIRQKRLEVLQKIDASVLTSKTNSFLKGIILADRTEMDTETVQDFNKSGLVHFLAISGTHFAIIFGMLLLLLKPMFPVRYSRIPVVLSLLLIWGFAVFIGYGNSVVRSCLMITAYYAFVLLQRKPDLLHSTSLAGFVILIADSQQLFDIGFQLSFAAVVGIYAFNIPLMKLLPRPRNKFQNLLFNIITVSLSAQLATMPFVLYYFHQYSFLSLVANLVVLPFSEIIILFSLLMTVLYAFAIEIVLMTVFYEAMVKLLLKVIHFFAAQEAYFAENMPFSAPEMLLALEILYFFKLLLDHQSAKNGIRFIGIVMVFMAFRMMLNFYFYHKEEYFLVDYFKDKIVVVKNHNKAVFWIPEMAKEDQVRRFVVQPYAASRRIKKYEIKTIPSNAVTVTVNGKIMDLK